VWPGVLVTPPQALDLFADIQLGTLAKLPQPSGVALGSWRERRTRTTEVGHILVDEKRSVIIEDGNNSNGKEAEANAFAADVLVPPSTHERRRTTSPLTEGAIRQTARDAGVAPGIIVGWLRQDRILGYDRMNHLKERFSWVPIRREEPAVSRRPRARFVAKSIQQAREPATPGGLADPACHARQGPATGSASWDAAPR